MSRNNLYYIYLAALLLVTTMFSCSKKAPDEFEVQGKLQNISDSYFIAVREQSDSIIVDTVQVDNKGQFLLHGSVDTLTVMSMYFNNNMQYAYILLDKGWDIQVNGDVLYSDLLDVKGGDVNDNLSMFKKQNQELLKKRADILKSLEDSSLQDDEELPMTTENALVADLQNVNFELSGIAAEYVKSNPDKISSVMIINAFFQA